MKIDWKNVKKALKAMDVPYQEREANESLVAFIAQCGYVAHPMIVNLSGLKTVDADIGVIVTHADETVNNGVSIFCVLENKALGLITVIPSTVAKGPMVRGVVGDITNAVTGITTPPLTPFDMIEITGQVIANTVMKNLITAFNIPKEKEHAFICIYLPKFLANVAMYYTGAADKEGKPMVHEEIADMEPAMIRQMLFGDDLPDIFKEQEKSEGGA